MNPSSGSNVWSSKALALQNNEITALSFGTSNESTKRFIDDKIFP